MRRNVYTLSVPWLAALLLSGCGGGSIPARQQYDAAYYRALEQAVFSESNRLRSAPADYTEVLLERRQQFRGKVYYRAGDPVGILTDEGITALDEALGVVQGQAPLPPLQWSEALAALARAHVADTGPRGLVGHDSSRGQGFSQRLKLLEGHASLGPSAENISYGMASGRDVVLQLLVDDGVPSRGHRDNLLRQGMRYSGVGCGYHRRYTAMCVVIYARGKG